MCEIDRFIEEKIEQGYFPGCVILVGNKNKNVFHSAYGNSEITPTKRIMKKDSIFDVASITKPIATSVSILTLINSGLMRLEDCASSILTELKDSVNKNVTVFELLTHSSFIPSWYPLYIHSDDEEEIIQFIGNMREEKSAYSCLDYILLGKIVERITGETLKDFTVKNIFKPMGMKDTGFCPAQRLKKRLVATEKGNRHEKELSEKYGENSEVPWRERTIVGEVHDGNSFYCFKGISGNAGLFSTASDLAIFARCVLQGGDKVLKPEIVQYLMEQSVSVDGERRSLGFLIGGDDFSELSQKTVWHTGFTGCAIWIDPVKEIFIVFLSNAVHPEVRPNILKPIRQQIINHCLNVTM